MQIQTCELSPTAPTTYQVPPGAIMLFNKASPTSCPAISVDWTVYTPAVGYALVGLPTSSPAPDFAMAQGTALSEAATDFTAHTFVLFKQMQQGRLTSLKAYAQSRINYCDFRCASFI